MDPLIKAVEMSSLSVPAAAAAPISPGLSPVMGSMPPADIEEEDIFKYRQ
ncbi:3146_t:CDS:2 [Rhizophagus irregularis]|nr:3146_t:CDS:2 [Rhizophagus irregularis]